MNVLVNGGINLSELDGWWVEAYTPEVGWALGDGKEHGDDIAWNAVEADRLYTLLEREVILEFYTRNEKDIPVAWVNRMRASMSQLTPRFSADRAVREYTEQHYIPSAASYRACAVNKGEMGKGIINWHNSLKEKWSAIRFGEMKTGTNGLQHTFEIVAYLNDIDPDSVRIELYADGINGNSPVLLEMTKVRQLEGVSSGYVYSASVSANRPPTDYTARIVPYYDGVSIPLEVTLLHWQR